MTPRILNIHTHCFTFDHVPRRIIPAMDLILFLAKRFPALLYFFLSERMQIFLTRGRKASQLAILETLAQYYPKDTAFAVHTMDFEYMNAGKCKPGFGFIDQLDQLAAIKALPQWQNRLFAFMAVDPRRPGLLELVKHYVLDCGFSGIKLYPPLGYSPLDERLEAVWAWASANDIPVMTHCSRSGPVHLKGRAYSKAKGDAWTAPENYVPLLERYPNLRICFAHFGGEKDCLRFYKGDDPRPQDNWFSQIVELLKRYRGAFADISYTSASADLTALFHVYAQGHCDSDHTRPCNLCDKILFGSDYYMAQLERNERWFSINVRSSFGEETFWRMVANSWNFLGQKA